MNKNAYEIRLSVLENAKDLVLDEYNREWMIWERKEAENKTEEKAPEFPSTQQILEKAKDLYMFVEQTK